MSEQTEDLPWREDEEALDELALTDVEDDADDGGSADNRVALRQPLPPRGSCSATNSAASPCLTTT